MRSPARRPLNAADVRKHAALVPDPFNRHDHY